VSLGDNGVRAPPWFQLLGLDWLGSKPGGTLEGSDAVGVIACLSCAGRLVFFACLLSNKC
jgi:hypothetical protein